MNKQREGSLSKTARLLLILRLQKEGKEITKYRLAKILGVSWQTIHRDYLDLARLQPILDANMQKVRDA